MPLEKGHSAFEQFRRKLDDSERRCRHCGYTDAEGGWRVTTSGSRVQYQHVCPKCDAIDTRELRLG